MSPSISHYSTTAGPFTHPARRARRVAVLHPIAFLLAALVLVVPALPDRASAGPNRRADVYEYRTSIACGSDPTEQHGLRAALYGTDLTLLNPGNGSAVIWMSIALGQRIGETDTSRVSTPFEFAVGAGHAFEIGCRDIAARFGNPSAEILSGYIVLESDVPLDVEVAHTATQDFDGREISIDVRPVAERRIALRGAPVHSGGGPIAICHGSGPGPGPAIGLTLYVDTISAREHRLHGDRLGFCRNAQP